MFNRTPNVDCYWVGAVPKFSATSTPNVCRLKFFLTICRGLGRPVYLLLGPMKRLKGLGFRVVGIVVLGSRSCCFLAYLRHGPRLEAYRVSRFFGVSASLRSHCIRAGGSES